MKVVIQRVIQASVTIQQQLHASIGRGMMILVGIQADDHEEDIEWLSSKICNLRIFDDENGIMNRSILGEQSFKEGEKDNLADEMADILWVLTCLANQTGVDLTEAMEINFAKKTARDLKRHKNNPKIQ